jgi:hypothetical protein
MNVLEIPHSQWPAYFDQFSRTHRAWLAIIDRGAPTPDQIEGVAHPLRSITPFVHNNRVVHIDIRFQDDTPGRGPLRVRAPVSVRVEETTEGIAQGVEFVDDQRRATRLRFRAATRPDVLDGAAPGELLP